LELNTISYILQVIQSDKTKPKDSTFYEYNVQKK